MQLIIACIFSKNIQTYHTLCKVKNVLFYTYQFDINLFPTASIALFVSLATNRHLMSMISLSPINPSKIVQYNI